MTVCLGFVRSSRVGEPLMVVLGDERAKCPRCGSFMIKEGEGHRCPCCGYKESS